MSKLFNFFKKNKQTQEDQIKMVDSNAKALDNIEFHTMPRKLVNSIGGSVHHTKKWGMVIVIFGVLVLLAGTVLLMWYIFKPQSFNTTEQTQTGNNVENVLEEEQSGQTQEEQTPVTENEEKDTAEKVCGQTDFFISESAGDYESNAALVCVGERLLDDCLRASVTFDTTALQGVRMSVLGLRQDECLVQLTYPSVDSISDLALKDYANSYIRCSYNKNDLAALNYQPARLAAYVYEQNTFDNLSENSACEGTAFTLWQERDSRTQENVGSAFISGVDADGDGLSDVEENTVFASSADTADTDNDNYSDGTEVLNLYNPAGNGLLQDSGLVGVYDNSVYGYSLLYPKNWRMEDEANSNNVIFFSGVGGFIQVITQNNEQSLSLSEWYADLNASVAKAQSSTKVTLNGLEFLYSPDGLTAYIVDPKNLSNIYVVTYSPEQSNRLDFMATFTMLINSMTMAKQ